MFLLQYFSHFLPFSLGFASDGKSENCLFAKEVSHRNPAKNLPQQHPWCAPDSMDMVVYKHQVLPFTLPSSHFGFQVSHLKIKCL